MGRPLALSLYHTAPGGDHREASTNWRQRLSVKHRRLTRCKSKVDLVLAAEVHNETSLKVNTVQSPALHLPWTHPRPPNVPLRRLLWLLFGDIYTGSSLFDGSSVVLDFWRSMHPTPSPQSQKTHSVCRLAGRWCGRTLE